MYGMVFLYKNLYDKIFYIQFANLFLPMLALVWSNLLNFVNSVLLGLDVIVSLLNV